MISSRKKTSEILSLLQAENELNDIIVPLLETVLSTEPGVFVCEVFAPLATDALYAADDILRWRSLNRCRTIATVLCGLTNLNAAYRRYISLNNAFFKGLESPLHPRFEEGRSKMAFETAAGLSPEVKKEADHLLRGTFRALSRSAEGFVSFSFAGNRDDTRRTDGHARAVFAALADAHPHYPFFFSFSHYPNLMALRPSLLEKYRRLVSPSPPPFVFYYDLPKGKSIYGADYAEEERNTVALNYTPPHGADFFSFLDALLISRGVLKAAADGLTSLDGIPFGDFYRLLPFFLQPADSYPQKQTSCFPNGMVKRFDGDMLSDHKLNSLFLTALPTAVCDAGQDAVLYAADVFDNLLAELIDPDVRNAVRNVRNFLYSAVIRQEYGFDDRVWRKIVADTGESPLPGKNGKGWLTPVYDQGLEDILQNIELIDCFHSARLAEMAAANIKTPGEALPEDLLSVRLHFEGYTSEQEETANALFSTSGKHSGTDLLVLMCALGKVAFRSDGICDVYLPPEETCRAVALLLLNRQYQDGEGGEIGISVPHSRDIGWGYGNQRRDDLLSVLELERGSRPFSDKDVSSYAAYFSLDKEELGAILKDEGAHLLLYGITSDDLPYVNDVSRYARLFSREWLGSNDLARALPMPPEVLLVPTVANVERIRRTLREPGLHPSVFVRIAGADTAGHPAACSGRALSDNGETPSP